MKKFWFKTVLVYGMWFVFILLGIWILIVGRNDLSEWLSRYYIQDNFQHSKEAQFFNQIYFFIAGLVLFILTIVVEEYFKHGARKDELAKRISKVMGFELMALLAVSLISAYLIGFSPLVWLILGAELVVSVGLIWFGVRKPNAVRPPLP
jgi:carbon starvation protein CstA